MLFVKNKAIEASSRRRENKHLGGKIFKNIVFLYNNIYFCPKMGCVTVFIYIYIILIFYWFSNHFCIFVCVVLSVTELWIQLSASHFCMSASYSCGRISVLDVHVVGFLDMEKVHFSLKIDKA